MLVILKLFYVTSAVVGLVCFRQINLAPIRALVIYWVFMVSVDLGLEQLGEDQTVVIELFYCLIHTIAFAVYVYIFNQNAPKKSFRYITQLIMLGVVGLFAVYQIVFNLDDLTASDDVFLIQGPCALFVVLLYFRDILFGKEVLILIEEPLFWIATGILFYTTGNLIATGFFHQIYASAKYLALALYQLNYVLNIVMSIAFGAAFVLSTQRLKTHIDGY
ncbi:hypothetical protein BN8_05190 [Fibrisoma limi BUZ 3]|uniref:YhhN family protein n=1 Tax=Fibrisoma limi BUZ 3 TaxID=1185876 RepID=I2GPR4_9BACT|nr:hypothetical protein [Fibrisoma limi]CCH55892.1 hypothetical protein BN8_05190 [Fibrisoma limi BUZ 3]